MLEEGMEKVYIMLRKSLGWAQSLWTLQGCNIGKLMTSLSAEEKEWCWYVPYVSMCSCLKWGNWEQNVKNV